MSGDQTLSLRRGSLYLTRAVYDRYFPGLDSVVLLWRGGRLAILPVHHAASGGYLIKRRNAAGDRVVTAPDFFRAQGVPDEPEIVLAVRWSAEDGALITDPVLNT